MELPVFESISQLYQEDCSPDAIFLPHFPTTYERPVHADSFYLNDKVYFVDDAAYEPSADSFPGYTDVVQYKVLPLFGDQIRILKPVPGFPPKELVQHWSRVMHDGKPVTWRTGELGEESTHIVKYPVDDLPRSLHNIDPDVLFEITSKLFVPKVNCQQPKVLVRDFDYPCVVKVGRSESGKGTHIVNSEKQHRELGAWIRSTMPRAETITTEFIDTRELYGTVIYLNRQGKSYWYAVTDMTMDYTRWNGCCFELDAQDRLQAHLKPVIEPITDALHQKGYFGLLSVDVLEDQQGKLYVVDINTRPGACSTAVFGLYKLMEKGHRAMAQYPRERFLGVTIEDLVHQVENVEDGDVLVSVAWEGDGVTMAELNVYAADLKTCTQIYERCKKTSNF